MFLVGYCTYFTFTHTHVFAEMLGLDFWPKQQSLSYLLLEEPERSFYKNFEHLAHREHEFVEFIETTKFMKNK